MAAVSFFSPVVPDSSPGFFSWLQANNNAVATAAIDSCFVTFLF
jgi:hypothetical protein